VDLARRELVPEMGAVLVEDRHDLADQHPLPDRSAHVPADVLEREEPSVALEDEDLVGPDLDHDPATVGEVVDAAGVDLSRHGQASRSSLRDVGKGLDHVPRIVHERWSDVDNPVPCVVKCRTDPTPLTPAISGASRPVVGAISRSA
jgi:hypothetical protein